jgi:hypothetical protein
MKKGRFIFSFGYRTQKKTNGSASPRRLFDAIPTKQLARSKLISRLGKMA